MTSVKSRGLGRGLEALIVDTEIKAESTPGATTKDGINYIDINEIKPNRNQPRKMFNNEKLQELADSIQEHGVIQPLIVRTIENGYELVAGERRWRAARLAGLKSVPCLIRELNEEENALIAIIENMQREDLNPIEEADGLNRMIEAFGLTQDQVSKSVGKSRPYITNSLRLLKLPEEIKTLLSQGDLSPGHGRAILAISDTKEQLIVAQKILNDGLSVRTVESMAEKKKAPKPARHKHAERDANLLQIERELKDSLGTKVKINMTGKKGKIEIEYYSQEELERLIEMLKSIS